MGEGVETQWCGEHEKDLIRPVGDVVETQCRCEHEKDFVSVEKGLEHSASVNATCTWFVPILFRRAAG